MSLDDIWNEPIVDSPLKRPRQSLFFPDPDSDNERPSKRVTPAPLARPDVDALFEDLDKDAGDADDDLRYKPLAPALDLARLAKEAEERHARGRDLPLMGESKTGPVKKDQEGDKPADGEKKGRKVLPKLDEERLVGPDGFPVLIESIRGFKPKGKGNEHVDLNRLLQIYQFWTHKMYPKMSFKDTVSRVEKLCHSKRMQVRVSVWRDEFNGITKEKTLADDSDVIDLTEPTLVGTEGDKESEGPSLKSDQAFSRPPSLPPASSEVDDDDFDIDAVIRAEEERLAVLRATADSGPPLSPIVLEKASSRSEPDTDMMDLDEASLWDAIDGPEIPPERNPPPSAPQNDDEIWDIIDQMLEPSRPAVKTHIPISGVNLVPSMDSTHSGNTSRATNDKDWDEMYS